MKQDLKLFDAEYRFMEIIWNSEPIHSRELAALCGEMLGWKRSTTYTVLKKLCEKAFLCNNDAIVTSLVTREQVQQYESRAIMEKSFKGSLPKFISSFIGDKKLSPKEAEEILNLINKHKE